MYYTILQTHLIGKYAFNNFFALMLQYNRLLLISEYIYARVFIQILLMILGGKNTYCQTQIKKKEEEKNIV